MAAKWMNQLDIHFPELGEKARMLNRRDKFIMKHDPAVVKRRDEAKARSKESKQQQQQQQQQEAGGGSHRDAHSSVTSDSSSDHNNNMQQERVRQIHPPQRNVTIENPSFVGMPPRKAPDCRTESTSDDSDFMSGEFH